MSWTDAVRGKKRCARRSPGPSKERLAAAPAALRTTFRFRSDPQRQSLTRNLPRRLSRVVPWVCPSDCDFFVLVQQPVLIAVCVAIVSFNRRIGSLGAMYCESGMAKAVCDYGAPRLAPRSSDHLERHE
ncbi:hypothetical protein MRX96_059801 [Rhipicephalus microplus]